jgi:hypothetical protein
VGVLYGEREKERGKQAGRERNREGEGERNREGEGERNREGERERNREGERDVEYVQNCSFLKGMTGALAPFSYLV